MASKYAKYVWHNGKSRMEHTLKAEAALGKKLPEGAAVHHHDENTLVICENNAYHKLLHLRHKALLASGDPHYRKCKYCGGYDSLDNMYNPNKPEEMCFHRGCRRDYRGGLKARVK